MTSTWSQRFRLNYQAPGDNLNAWGLILNSQVFQALEDAIAKRVAFALSGSKALSTANGAEDEARCAFLDVTGGTGGAITVPSVEKWYLVRNAASGAVDITTGGGEIASVAPGSVVFVVCDGSNVRLIRDALLATKAYVDNIAFQSVDLPGQDPSKAGAALFSDGATAAWRAILLADLQDYVLADAAALWTGSGDGVVTPTTVKDYLAPRAIAYAPAITLDLSDGRHFEIDALTGALALSFAGGLPGETGSILLKQDGTGGRIITITGARAPGGLLSFATDSNAENRLYYLVRADGSLELSVSRALAALS